MIYDDEPYQDWDESDLREELRERGLLSDGEKEALVKRLIADDEVEVDE